MRALVAAYGASLWDSVLMVLGLVVLCAVTVVSVILAIVGTVAGVVVSTLILVGYAVLWLFGAVE